MAQLIKIGAWFINLDNVRNVQDFSPTTRQNRLTLQFSDNPDASITLGVPITGAEAGLADLCVYDAGSTAVHDGTSLAVRDVASSERLVATDVLTWLANEIRIGDRAVPYSLITSLDAATASDGKSLATDGVPRARSLKPALLQSAHA